MHEIVLKGSPYQRGLDHGSTLEKEIMSFWDPICKLKKEKWSGFTGSVLPRMLKNIETLFPDLVEEMRGISDGCGLDFEDVLLMSSYHGIEAIGPRCTNVGFSNPDCGAIHGKTGDAEDTEAPFYLLQIVYPDNGPSFVNVCLVGTIWTEAGLNSIGLSCGQSSSSIISGQDGRGIPSLITPRPVLQHCSSVEEGIEMLSKYELTGKGLNIFLADSQGDMAVVEKCYDKQAVRRPEDGALWNANRFLDKDLAKFNFTKGEYGRKNCQEREAFLRQTLLEKQVPRTVEEMKKILASHEEPGTICKHNMGPNRTCTHFGAVFIPREKRALIAHGNPCENEFKEYRL